MLEINDLQLGYSSSTVLEDVDLEVQSEQIVAVLGRNGVGKTTLIKGIIGINSPTAGEVLLNDEDVTGLKPYQIANKGVGYIPQSRDIFGSISVANNIRLGSATSNSVQLRDEVPEFIYDYFPALLEKADQRGDVLSGGQQQQLAIARALASNPDLLLLDEPSEGIQPSIVKSTADSLQKLPENEGMSLLIVEQNLDFVLDTADYCYILDNGGVVEQGDVAELNDAGIIQEHLTL